MERSATAPPITAAHLWHSATFAVGAFGVIAQLWIVATQTLTEEMIQLSEPIAQREQIGQRSVDGHWRLKGLAASTGAVAAEMGAGDGLDPRRL